MPRPNLDPSDLEHFERAIDNGSWDGGAAMSSCAKSSTPASCYGAICAGKRAGDSSKQDAWALPHHARPGAPANASGVRNALGRLPQTQGLINRAAAEAHLQAHMKQIQAASKPPAGQPRSDGPPRANLIRAIRDGVALRAAANGASMPTLSGHLAVFNQWTEIDSIFEGRFLEQLAPGAFSQTIKEDRASMRVLFQHGRDPQIGNKPLGPIEELTEDKTGVAYAAPMLDTSYNRDLIPGLEAGLYGASFRFEVLEQDFNNKPERSDYNPEGIPERTVKSLRMMEFGPVTFPAYAGATAGLRSLTDEFIFAAFLSDPERLRQLIESAPTSAALSQVATLSRKAAEGQPHSHGESHSDPDRPAPLVVIRNPNRRL